MERHAHNPAENRFETWIGDELAGRLEHELHGDVASFDHTIVDPSFEGRGIAGRLVRYALDTVRDEGRWRVHPVCPYVVAWLGKHPGYEDLLAPEA